MTARSSRTALRLPFFIAFTLTCGLSATEQGGQAERDPQDPRWSTAGRLAQQRIDEIKQRLTIGSGGCRNEPECEDEAPLVASTLQSETSIAVDATGQHVVVGFNDFRGFADASKATSLSGFMYSDDGGLTFTDGGQLPSPGTDIVGGQRFPQIFGDPDVKYVGACTFLYASIGIQKFGASGLAQALVVHRSTDCGHTWTGPFIVPPTINPNGGVDVNGNAGDAADKELTDVDPDTGRYMLCWTNFSGLVEISCTYSDDILSPTPTFAPAPRRGNPADRRARVRGAVRRQRLAQRRRRVVGISVRADQPRLVRPIDGQRPDLERASRLDAEFPDDGRGAR